VKSSRLVIALLAAVLLPSAALAALGLRSLAKESARVEARFREQADGAASAAADALAALVNEVREGGAGSTALAADASGVLLEPRPSRGNEAETLPPPQELDRGLSAFLLAEVDRLQAGGDTEQAARRLREVMDREGDPVLGAWAATALAALEDRAGHAEQAREVRKQIVERFPETRDERRLKRAFAARWELARSEGDLEQLLALDSDLIDDCVAVDETATGALQAAVADELRARLAASKATNVVEARAAFAGLENRQRERAFVRRLLALERVGLSDWLARAAPGGVRLFELPEDPLRPDRARVLIAVAPSDAGGWRGGALELRELARTALARPEIAAYAALGFATALVGDDGGRIGSSSEPAGEVLVTRRLAAPLDSLTVTAFGADLEGFRARDRRRLALVGSLTILAFLIAALAGFATVRAVSREMRAVRDREAFVAAVTHELKAPLASIRLLAEVLAQGGVEERKVREFGARTVGEADRLSRLVDSVLESARLEQRPTTPLVPLDLAEVARDACATFEPVARERGFQVELRLEGPAPIALGDRNSLTGALLNLLDNAVKYSDRAHAIEVEVRSDGPRAILAVLDRGRGVPPEEAARIFEPFQRLGDELTRDRPGVGLGLMLVHRIALSHGGRASCESREGGGSRFSIELPRFSPPSAGGPSA
jgi:signal transduction histidine kinase